MPIPSNISSFANLIAFFDYIVQNNVALKDFVHGDSERIVNRTRSDIMYPCLWLEWPSAKFNDYGKQNFQMCWEDLAFVILDEPDRREGYSTTTTNPYEQEDNMMESTFQIVLQVISFIMSNTTQGSYSFNISSVRIEPLNRLLIDDDCGWRVSLKICNKADVMQSNNCMIPANWNQLP